MTPGESDHKSGFTPPEQITGPILQSEPILVKTMSLSRKRWDRLKAEAQECKMGWTELWLGAAFAFVGIGAGAWVAFWALPSADPSKPHASQLSSHAQDNLRLIGTFALVVGLVCLLAWLHFRREHNADLDGLIRNMESQEHDDA
jgi:uncharacterized protein YjeT (DUF2065 family)